MIFLFDLKEKKKTMPARYMKYEYLSNNSMALRIRYKKKKFFKILTLCIERVVWDKRYFQFYLIYREDLFSVTNFFVFTPKSS